VSCVRFVDRLRRNILTTYDGKLADWTMSSHEHRGLLGYELTLADPRQGTTATQTTDVFSRLLLDPEDHQPPEIAAGPPRGAVGPAAYVRRQALKRLNKHIPNGDDRVNTGGSMSDADTATLGAEIWRDCDEARWSPILD
jgi:hypothetical protein